MSSFFEEHFATNVYYDRTFDCDAAKILPGEYYFTGKDMLIVTVLGSCVSACICDRVSVAGGTNNLLHDDWQLSGEFDAIFCRNVMIYFDKPTQSSILKKFVPLMKSDALLFAGHSENFLYVSDDFELRGKTVYELAKPGSTTGKRHK